MTTEARSATSLAAKASDPRFGRESLPSIGTRTGSLGPRKLAGRAYARESVRDARASARHGRAKRCFRKSITAKRQAPRQPKTDQRPELGNADYKARRSYYRTGRRAVAGNENPDICLLNRNGGGISSRAVPSMVRLNSMDPLIGRIVSSEHRSRRPDRGRAPSGADQAQRSSRRTRSAQEIRDDRFSPRLPETFPGLRRLVSYLNAAIGRDADGANGQSWR